MITRGCNVVAKGLGTFYYSKMAESKKSTFFSDLSPKKSAVPEVEEQVTPCGGILCSLRWRSLLSGRPSSGSTTGSQYDVRRHKACVCVYKIKCMEHTRAWLLNSSCSDILLATQD